MARLLICGYNDGWCRISHVSSQQGEQARHMTDELTLKLMRWAIFTAAFSVIPLGILFLVLFYSSKPHAVKDVIGDGELLLISWILAIGSLGELFPEGSTQKIAALFFAGANAIVVVLSLAMFVIVRYVSAGDASHVKFTIWSSIILFISSLFTSAACIALAEI